MTQFSLPSLDQARQLSGRTPSSSDAAAFLSSLRPGQVLQAQVVQSLGDSLFTLKFADLNITTASTTPLAAGDRLTLEVNSNVGGKPTLSVVTVSEGAIASSQARTQGTANRAGNPESPSANQQPLAGSSNRPQVLAQIVGKTSSSSIPAPSGQATTAGATTAQTTGKSSPLVSPLEISAGSGAATGQTVNAPLSQVGPAVFRELQSLLGFNDQVPDQTAISPKLAALLQPNGPVARLLEKRPDLAPRLESLLTEFQQRPGGLGKGLDQLAEQLSRLIQSAPPDQQSSLSTTQSRLVSQILGSSNLDQPEQLAQELASRMQQWVRSFEGTLARALPETPGQAINPQLVDPNLTVEQVRALANVADDQLATPPQPGLSRSVPVSTQPELSTTRGFETLPTSSPIAHSVEQAVAEGGSSRSVGVNAGQVVRGTFESDLKGQLLELRSQLEGLADRQPVQAASSQQAIARVDALLNQVTAQQVRNVEGLNQFLYAELPVDPKSGIAEARLQVFYRNQGATARGSDNDRFTVALFLNLTKLGDVLAVVSEVEKAVTVGFTVENPAARNLLSSQTDLLRAALVKSGHAGATVTVRASAKPEGIPAPGNQAEEDIWQSFLEAGPVTGDPGGRLDLEA